MTMHVGKVAVLGSGVMGSAIAAHFANAGIPSLVLDIVPGEATETGGARGPGSNDAAVRNRIAVASVQALAKARPAPLFSAWRLGLIETGNFEDDLHRIADADWVIEVVKEDLEIKQDLLARAAAEMSDTAILSSNTSGLSLRRMAEALPESMRPRFLGTHFFNPPRYMRLLELIPTPDTDPEVLERVSVVGRTRLGKGIVLAKDTPNFIANRIGTHALFAAVRVMQDEGLTIEELDALTGPVLGRPKTATFRLADLVGLDTLLLVARHTHALTPDDESRETFVAPDFLVAMVDEGLLGRKSGAGFYRKVKGPEKKIQTLDLETLSYRDSRQPDLPGLAVAKGIDDPGARIANVVAADGRAARAAWKILAATLSYAAMRLGEIADRADSIDRAIELGFNWELGPFRIWDALGFRETTDRLRADGYPLPGWVDALYDDGAISLFQVRDGVVHGPAAGPEKTAPVAADPATVKLDGVRSRRGEILRNDSASLLDLDEGVFDLEFHTKMNAIDDGTIEMIRRAVAEVEANGQALVVANEGSNFCAGANLAMLAQHAQAGQWEAIEEIIRSFQAATDLLERCRVPVVVAAHGMALGGGCEVVLAGNAVRASAELYAGLVEVGAGLIPAGGGCLRLYKRLLANLPDPKDLYPALRRAFDTIGMAKVSTSAEEARELGFLRVQDDWSMNGDHRIGDARALALSMARGGWTPPAPERALPVMGRGGMAVIGAGLVNMSEGGFISEHDRKIGLELAKVLSGGDVAGPTAVSEQHILDLEREAFLRLCGEPKTHQRIAGLLETGKPVRN